MNKYKRNIIYKMYYKLYNVEKQINFEWDTEKNLINIRKHNISFEVASRVFLDENRIEMYDLDHNCDEERWQTIGLVEDVLFVVYTTRKENIRLISARKAEKEEMEEYYGKNY